MIILTITESTKQILSGIPEFITVSTSSVSTVFYTLDDSEPDTDSEIAVGKIFLTYDKPSVTLKLKAVSLSDESDILSLDWGIKTPNYDRVLLTKKEGVNILPFGEPSVNSLAEDQDGYQARRSAIEFIELDIKATEFDMYGRPILDGSSIPFIKFPKVKRLEKKEESSTSDINFDPTAMVILIDGYNDFDNQEIRVINRPMGTMSPVGKFYNEPYRRSIVSGDFTNYMYNPITKKIVLYYRESLEGRQIISTQKVDKLHLDLSPSATDNRFVFRWVYDRKVTKLF